MPKKGTNPAGYLMYWVKRIELKEANSFIGNLLATDEERKIFEDSIAELSMIFFRPETTLPSSISDLKKLQYL